MHVVFATTNHIQMHTTRIDAVHFPITTRKDVTPDGMRIDGSWIVGRTAISVRVIMTRMVGGTIVVRIGAVITAVVGRRWRRWTTIRSAMAGRGLGWVIRRSSGMGRNARW